jgi:hypothetical protein
VFLQDSVTVPVTVQLCCCQTLGAAEIFADLGWGLFLTWVFGSICIGV